MTGILTAVGEAKVAGSIGGTAINFAVIRIGDGNGVNITPNRLMTDLVRRVGNAYPVTASARDPDNPTHWRVTTEIPAGQGPFTLREIAVFDAAGDMLAIAPHPVVEFTGPGGDQISIITDIVFPVSGTANVSVTISPSAAVPLARNHRPFFMVVESASTVAPPATPAVGATFIVPANATGAWAGQAGNLAQWTGESWSVASAPVGHLVCVNDQAEGSDNRYLRKAANSWVSAKAGTAAFGFARMATPQEIMNRTPGPVIGPDALVWTNLGDRPTEFPPSAHTHDDRYYTEAEADGRFVRLNPAGGSKQTITGAGITIQGAWPTYNLQRTADAQDNTIFGRRTDGKAMWGLGLGQGISDDMFISRWNVVGDYTDMPFRITYAGDTSIGVPGRTTTIQKSVVGDDRIELGVNNSGDRAAYIDFHASGAAGANDFSARILRNAGANGTLEFANTGTGGIALGSPVSLSGSLGASGNVAKSNGSGGPPSWASMADLQPQIQYDHVIAQGVTWTINTTNTWTKLPLNTLVANAIPGASVSSGTVTLPAGTYEVIGRVNQSVGAGTRWQGRVRNTSSNTTIAVTLLGGASGYEPITEHTAIGRFTLASASTIELQCYAENATNGAVQNIASGEPIILNSLTITKIG